MTSFDDFRGVIGFNDLYIIVINYPKCSIIFLCGYCYENLAAHEFILLNWWTIMAVQFSEPIILDVINEVCVYWINISNCDSHVMAGFVQACSKSFAWSCKLDIYLGNCPVLVGRYPLATHFHSIWRNRPQDGRVQIQTINIFQIFTCRTPNLNRWCRYINHERVILLNLAEDSRLIK